MDIWGTDRCPNRLRNIIDFDLSNKGVGESYERRGNISSQRHCLHIPFISGSLTAVFDRLYLRLRDDKKSWKEIMKFTCSEIFCSPHGKSKT